MANRPVFHAIDKQPFCKVVNVDFQFCSGFSTSQKQKSIANLHREYLKINKGAKLLEISSKGKVALGNKLSAFNLNYNYKGKVISVECAFQASKVFENGGPYEDLYFKTSVEAKRDSRLRESGKLVKFSLDDIDYPLEPKDAFYLWIYINALQSKKTLTEQLLAYDSFTDIEFNPNRSINCQAKAVAVYVGLVKGGKIEVALENFTKFVEVVYDYKL